MSPLARLIRWCLDNRLVVVLAVVGLGFWGVLVAPFDWELAGIPRDPVPVDAIPDIGENQQIVVHGVDGPLAPGTSRTRSLTR